MSASEATLKRAPWWKERIFDEYHRSTAKLLWYSFASKHRPWKMLLWSLYFMHPTFASIARNYEQLVPLPKRQDQWYTYLKGDNINGTNTYKVTRSMVLIPTSHQATKPSSHQATKPPSHQATKPPSYQHGQAPSYPAGYF